MPRLQNLGGSLLGSRVAAGITRSEEVILRVRVSYGQGNFGHRHQGALCAHSLGSAAQPGPPLPPAFRGPGTAPPSLTPPFRTETAACAPQPSHVLAIAAWELMHTRPPLGCLPMNVRASGTQEAANVGNILTD